MPIDRKQSHFVLAYYLGRKAVTDPTAFFHIVSRDKGYDPMIEHLKLLHVRVTRHENFDSLAAAVRPAVSKKAASQK